MRITVRAFGSFRDIMQKECVLELPEGATIRDLLAAVTGRFPGMQGALYLYPHTIRVYVNILKNGRNIHFTGGTETMLDDGDVIALFPPSAGG